jgi:ABC-2 type transport system permease protein
VRGFWPIFKRELFALFVTPLAWIAITAFLLVQGLHFFVIVANFAVESEILGDTGPVQAFFGGTVLLYLPLLFICPLLTMRLFAEERRTGTIETLLTAPVSTPAVVLAKYAATLATYCAMWVPTVLYIVILARTGDVDWRIVGTSYATIFAVGAGYLAIGTMTSALAQSQLTAAALASMVLLGLFILGLGEFNLPDGPLRDICGHVSVWAQMNDGSRGILDSRRVLYDATLVLLPLFVTVRAVDAWRWG